ncbi:MAG: DUF362 domain-containing protein [Methanocellales archaeon]
MKPEVFFTNARAAVVELEKWYQPELSLVSKLERLITKSQVLDIVEKGDMVALKTHFGDRGNTKMLRSIFIRKVAEMVRERGAMPFVTETTGLGMIRDRNYATGRIQIAMENGYTYETLSAPIIIADGLKGFDYVEVEVKGLQLKKVYIAKAIAEADKLISLAHFKGHFRSGFGGTLKNIGVGCVAKPSKYDIHIYDLPKIDREKCNQCLECVKICPTNAITSRNNEIELIKERCIRCLGCYEVCKSNAIQVEWTIGRDIAERIIDCANAVIKLKGRENFAFLNFLVDITPHCDCHPYSDLPIVPDLGIAASREILSLEKASIDLINSAPTIQGSLASLQAGIEDKFHATFNWNHSKYQLEAAKKSGLGTFDYELISID